MPYPNWHSGRVRDPNDFLDDDKVWATVEIKPGIRLITGKLKKDGMTGPMTAQAYRFDKTKFTVDQAKKWLKKHKVKVILFEPAKEEVKEVGRIAKDIFNELCKTPGLKIRSKGKGRGLARGKGRGPIGVPFGETSVMANIAPNIKPWGAVILRRKKKMGVTEQKVAATANGSLYNMKGSYEDLRDKIRKALVDTQLYGKYPEIVSTFPRKVFVSADGPNGDRYFEIEWRLEGDEVKLGAARQLEKQVKFLVKEWAEEIKTQMLFG